MFEFNRYIPIAKVDDEERMVYGFASTPDLDSDGEIISLDGLRKALPEYLQFPTLREMHQPKAAGTVKNTEIKQEGKVKGLYIGAKVVADDAWNLVKEGVYRGFSIGGNVVNKVGNIIEELSLVEISLVDVPANKKAKIEVWKAGKITKDAETVYSLSNIMITLKDTIMYFEALGKPTKDLEKALEQIKGVIAQEAGESEKESRQRMDDMWSEMLMSDNPDTLKKLLKSLDTFSFEEGSVPELLRKVVKINMAKKIEKHEDVETPKVEVEKPEVAEEVKDTPESPETEKPVEVEEVKEVEEGEEVITEPEEEPEVEETEEPEEEVKETVAVPEFEKLDAVNEKLEKIAEKPEVEDLSKLNLEKGFEKIVSVVEKMSTLIEGFGERLAKIEGQPLPLKSKQAYVEIKKGEETPEEVKKVDSDSEIGKKKARLAELTKILESIGKNEFAKQGFSFEAARLQDEIAKLGA